MDKERDTSLTIQIEPSLRKAAETAAASDHETLSQVLRRALQQYVQAKTVRRSRQPHERRIAPATGFPVGFIHLLTQSNPKRDASKDAFALYQEGMSTAEYEERLKEPLQGRKFKVAEALAWDVARQLIQICDYCGIILTECSPSASKAHRPVFHARRSWLVGDSGDRL
jgi:hypothetical protein